jgi:hypothetical protein
MTGPEIVLRRPRPDCRLSIILLDWGVRESFHTLHYLNQQTAPRPSYELIWLEFYARRPAGLQRMVRDAGRDGPALDQWIIAGYPDDHIFNKHRLYNLGLLAARGDVCVFCDSDAIYRPTFVQTVLEHLARRPATVLHLDEVRNTDRGFYPFRYPTIEDILGPGCRNWKATVSSGLASNCPDRLHEANYGACMAARRDELLAVGGADEHLDFLGYICGPYEMTFRLGNKGRPECWRTDEYLYHTWHPNQSGINTDYQGPHDGLFVSLRALEARAIGRVMPYVENPWIARLRHGEQLALETVLPHMVGPHEPAWRIGRQPVEAEAVYKLERDYQGFNLFLYRGRWYALPVGAGDLEPRHMPHYHPLLDGENQDVLRRMVRWYNRLPSKVWARIGGLPLHRLPWRLVRRMGKELAWLAGRS